MAYKVEEVDLEQLLIDFFGDNRLCINSDTISSFLKHLKQLNIVSTKHAENDEVGKVMNDVSMLAEIEDVINDLISRGFIGIDVEILEETTKKGSKKVPAIVFRAQLL